MCIAGGGEDISQDIRARPNLSLHSLESGRTSGDAPGCCTNSVSTFGERRGRSSLPNLTKLLTWSCCRQMQTPQMKVRCGGLTLAGGQVPPKAALSPPSSAGQGRGNGTKGSWVEIRAGRDHSPITVKTDSNREN